MISIDVTTTLKGMKDEDLFAEKSCFVVKEGEEELLTDEKGKPIIVTIESPDEILTVRKVLTNALLAPSKEKVPAEDKYLKYKLYQKVRDTTSELELSPKEAKKIKALVGMLYETLVAGQIFDLLEPKGKKEVEEVDDLVND